MEKFLEKNMSKNVDSFLITNQDINEAQQECAYIENASVRARMVANLYSVLGAKKFFTFLGGEVSTKNCLQNIQSIFSKNDISEIYVNGHRVSVRLNFEDYKLFIPKKHEKYGFITDIIMFVRFEDFKIKVLGFLERENLYKLNSDNDNYYVRLKDLKPIDKVKEFFYEEIVEENIDNLKNERIKIIQYLLGKLQDKIEFFNLLSKSDYLRDAMIKYEIASKYYKLIIENENVIKSSIESETRAKNEIAKRLNSVNMSDAFIQNFGVSDWLSDSSLEHIAGFKNDCAKANIEKLFNYSLVVQEKDCQDKYDEDDEIIFEEDRLPMKAILDAFKLFTLLFLICLITCGIFCYIDYKSITSTKGYLSVRSKIHKIVENVKKK